VAEKSSKIAEYKVGDMVVYPAHGVGIVEAVQARSVSGDEQKFYMITIMDSGMKIMVPLRQAETVGLRRVVDTATVDKVYEILRDRNIVVDTQTWNRRFREYTQKIKTGSVFEIAKVMRDLCVLRTDKELSFGERKMLDTAQGLLVKEISIAKSCPEDLVRSELDQLFDAALPSRQHREAANA
jgi:CarD family transcriptional regulator